MLTCYFKILDFFITCYKERKRVFQGEDLHIDLKEGANPIRQKSKKMKKETNLGFAKGGGQYFESMFILQGGNY